LSRSQESEILSETKEKVREDTAADSLSVDRLQLTRRLRLGAAGTAVLVGPEREVVAQDLEDERRVLGHVLVGVLARQDRLVVTDGIQLEAAKTRLLANQLKSWSLEKVLIIVEATDEKLYLASRNLPYVEVLEANALNPLALASYDKVLMTVAAVKRIEERLQ